MDLDPRISGCRALGVLKLVLAQWWGKLADRPEVSQNYNWPAGGWVGALGILGLVLA